MSKDVFPTGLGAVIKGRWEYDDRDQLRVFTRVGHERWSFARPEQSARPVRHDITNQSTIHEVEVLSDGIVVEPTGQGAVVLHNDFYVMLAVDDYKTQTRKWMYSDGSGYRSWNELANPKVLFEGYDASN